MDVIACNKSVMISIVIPVYNNEEALKKALFSISGQSYKEVQVIVVDDGSTPPINSLDSSILIIRQENKGAPVARNAGRKKATGDYVIFWDVDVVAKPDMLKKMKEALDKNPKASFSYSNFYYGRKKMPAMACDSDALKKNNYIHTTTLLRTSDAWEWDQSLKRFQDWDYWLTLIENGRAGVWIDEYLFFVEPGGTMSSWLPSFAYNKPWRYLPGVHSKVRAYEEAKNVILTKHV